MIYKTAELLASEGISFSGPITELGSTLQDLATVQAVLTQPIISEFEISVGSKEFLLLGDVSGNFELVCSRCLEKFSFRYRHEIENTYPLTVAEINVGEEIRQAVILALPDKPLCRAGCRGLCPQCGINLNHATCSCQVIPNNPFAKLGNIFHPNGKDEKE